MGGSEYHNGFFVKSAHSIEVGNCRETNRLQCKIDALLKRRILQRSPGCRFFAQYCHDTLGIACILHCLEPALREIEGLATPERICDYCPTLRINFPTEIQGLGNDFAKPFIYWRILARKPTVMDTSCCEHNAPRLVCRPGCAPVPEPVHRVSRL